MPPGLIANGADPELDPTEWTPLAEFVEASGFPILSLLPEAERAALFAALRVGRVELCNGDDDDDDTVRARAELFFRGELILRPLPTNAIALAVAGTGDHWTRLDAAILLGPEPAAALFDVLFDALVDRAYLQPMRSPTEVDTEATHTRLSLGRVTVSVDGEGAWIDVAPNIRLPLCMIGRTGVLVQADAIRWIGADDAHDDIVAEDFTGVYATSVRLYLPDLDIVPDLLKLDECYIGSTGLSCKTEIVFSVEHDGHDITNSDLSFQPFDGWQAALAEVEVEIRENVPSLFRVAGVFDVPMFPVLCRGEFGIGEPDVDGRLTSTLSLETLAAGGLTIGPPSNPFGRVSFERIRVDGSISADAFSVHGVAEGLHVDLSPFALDVALAGVSFKREAVGTSFAFELTDVPLGALGTVDRAILRVSTTTDDAGGETTDAVVEAEVSWAHVRDRLSIPDDFPAPPAEGSVTATVHWTERAGARVVVLHVETAWLNAHELWPFVPTAFRPEVRRFALTADLTYTSGADAANAATSGPLTGSNGTAAAIAATIELRLPPFPNVPGTELIHVRAGDADGWITATLALVHDVSGANQLSLSVTDPIAIGIGFPGMPQETPPVQLAVTSIGLEISDAGGGEGAFLMAGTFRLHPVVPPLDLPIGEQLADLLAGFGLSDLEGKCSLSLAFQDGKSALSLDAAFEHAEIEVRLFEFLSSVARGVSAPAGAAVQEVPFDLDVGLGLKRIRFQLGTLDTAPTAARVSIELVTSMHVGEIEAEGSLRLSDIEASIGFSRLDIPLRLPRFPLRRSDLAGCLHRNRPAWDARVDEWRSRWQELQATPGRAALREANALGGRIALVSAILPLRERVGATASTASERLAARNRFDDEVGVLLDGLEATTGFWQTPGDVKLRIADARVRVPFQNPRNFGVEGSVRLAGFDDDDPLKPLETLVLTLGISADLIYAALEMAKPVAIPSFGRYDGGSIQIGKLMLGFGYTRRSLAIAFDGTLVLPPRLIEDANTSQRIGAGIVLPRRSRVYFRFELIPVPVVVAVPYFEFNIDLRDTFSPALDDEERCIPHWDGLQLYVPNVLRMAGTHLSFSPMFGFFVAPNVHQAYAFELGTRKNGYTFVLDDALVIFCVMNGSGPLTIPLFADGLPFTDHRAENYRLAGFELNFDLQRPFPSLDPLALFEALALIADPLMPIDPNGRLANTVRVTLANPRLVLPPVARAIFPWAAEVTRFERDYTVNLETIITPLQHAAALVKHVLDELSADRPLEERLARLATSPPVPDLAMMLDALPPQMRVRRFDASFGGFSARAVVALIDRDRASDELANGGNRRVLTDSLFDDFRQADLASVPLGNHGAGVIVGAQVDVIVQHYSFVGQIYEDGAFTLVTSAVVDPLRLNIAGISTPIGIALSARMSLAGAPGPRGLRAELSASGTSAWHPFPGFSLEIGTKKKPARLRLQSDGRFRLRAAARASLFGGAVRGQGTVNVSDNHCLVRGTVAGGIGKLLAMTIRGSGRVGPGPRFSFAGDTTVSVLGHPLSHANAEISERGVKIEGRLTAQQWRIGPVVVDGTVRANVAGSLTLYDGTIIAASLSGSGSVALPTIGTMHGPKASGRALVAIDGDDSRLELEGAIDWLGRRWASARLTLATTFVEANGVVGLAFSLTPGAVGGISVAHIVARAHLDARVRVNGHGALLSWSIAGDAAIGVRLPGQNQIVPLAMARIPATSGDSDMRVEIGRVAGLGALPGDFKIDLPIPTVDIDPTKKSIHFPSDISFDQGSIDFLQMRWTAPSLSVTWKPAFDVVTGVTASFDWTTAQQALGNLAIPSFRAYLVWGPQGFGIEID